MTALAAKAGSMSTEELRSEREKALVRIGFLQHERLIHYLVTMTFAIITFLAVLAFVICGHIGSSAPELVPLIVLLLVLLVPYIRHYYILENGVQKLYSLYDEL